MTSERCAATANPTATFDRKQKEGCSIDCYFMTNLPCASTDIIRPHQGLPSSNFYSEIQRIVVFPWCPPPAPFSTDFTERNSVQEKLRSWVEVLYWPLFKICNQDTKEKRLHWKLSRGPILQLGHWFLFSFFRSSFNMSPCALWLPDSVHLLMSSQFSQLFEYVSSQCTAPVCDSVR